MRKHMKMKVMLVLGAVSILMAGCRNSNEEDNVVSQRFLKRNGMRKTTPAK
jgi:hypothetical protein